MSGTVGHVTPARYKKDKYKDVYQQGQRKDNRVQGRLPGPKLQYNPYQGQGRQQGPGQGQHKAQYNSGQGQVPGSYPGHQHTQGRGSPPEVLPVGQVRMRYYSVLLSITYHHARVAT